MSQEQLALLAAVVSGASGLLGAAIGGGVSYLITKRQLRATVLGASRSAWINDLRSTAAELGATLVSLSIDLEHDALDQATHDRLTHRSAHLKSQMELLLTPGKPSHDELIEKLETFYQSWGEKPEAEGGTDFNTARNDFVAAARSVLYAEWNKLKDRVQ